MKTIYLDYNATTPVDESVFTAMSSFLKSEFGNPSSHYPLGYRAKKAVESSRNMIAKMIKVKSDEIIFTSGGTESNNLAILGYISQNGLNGNHIITSSIEHPATKNLCAHLSENGFEITYLPVNNEGRIKPKDLETAIKPKTVLISVIHSNNEIGTLQPVDEIGKIAKEYGITFHSDAAQSIGKVIVEPKSSNIDLLSIAGHKFYAPKGIGALYIRNGIKLQNIIHGANQEKGLRPGTENVPYIVALGKAAELVTNNLTRYNKHMLETSALFLSELKKYDLDYIINSPKDKKLPNTLNISFRNIRSRSLLDKLEYIAISSGSACHSDKSCSDVLKAVNVSPNYIRGSIRVSTGRYTTYKEIRKAVEQIAFTVRSLE